MSGDPTPLTRTQALAVVRATVLELGWGLRLAARERSCWRICASRIPDPQIREDALLSLTRKKHYTDGAALLWMLPDRRDPQLLRLLVNFQITADFLDHASERGARRRGHCAGGLMRALVDAVDLDPLPGEYYADHPWADDGGYLRGLVLACRHGSASLPGYEDAKRSLRQQAQLLHALELQHDPAPLRRDDALRRYAADVFGAETEMTAVEAVGSASSGMTVLVTLALSSEADSSSDDRRAAVDAYTWVGALAAMLDGYVDRAEDAISGDWSSVGCFDTITAAEARIEWLIDRTFREVTALRNGERHAVVVAAMVAMFLSHRELQAGDRSASADRMARAGGSLTRLLVPALRAWRIGHRQRHA